MHRSHRVLRDLTCQVSTATDGDGPPTILLTDANSRDQRDRVHAVLANSGQLNRHLRIEVRPRLPLWPSRPSAPS
ncbi:hypothetical protein GCM10009634_73580 [Saccharothrix xinjiangensis]